MTNRELKSKVMTLGNKLAPRMGGDRRAAFVEAWAIVKVGGLEMAVRGVSFGNRQEALKRLAGYAPEQVRAVLVPEPANPADPRAMAVMVGVNGGKGLFRLGYVPRNMPRSWRPWAGSSRPCGWCPEHGAVPTRPLTGRGWPWQYKDLTGALRGSFLPGPYGSDY
jgi:hypothetical protein